MRRLNVGPLRAERINACYPLWRLEFPGLDLEAWRCFAQGHLASSESLERGILVAEDERDCVLGVLIYEIGQSLDHERQFSVLSMTAHDFFPSARREVAAALLEGAEQLARAGSCRALRTTLPLSEAGSTKHWLADLLAAKDLQLAEVPEEAA